MNINMPRNACCSVTKLHPTLGTPRDRSLPDFSVREISQVRILEWVAISFSKGSSDPGLEPTPPAWQVDSLPPSHKGSPVGSPLIYYYKTCTKCLAVFTTTTPPPTFYFKEREKSKQVSLTCQFLSFFLI